MSASEWIAIVGGLALGFWLVSVFLPHARGGAQAAPDDGSPANGAPTWHEVLGVSPDADRTRIVAAYRHKVAQYDAAAVAHLAPDIRALAEARLDEINAAYQAALAATSATG